MEYRLDTILDQVGDYETDNMIDNATMAEVVATVDDDIEIPF